MRDESLRAREPIDFRFFGACDLAVRVDLIDFGPVTMTSLTTAGRFAMDVARTSALIRQSDPEAYRLLLNLGGRTALSQDRQDIILGPGEMAFYDTSRPHHGWRRVDGGAGRLLMLSVPRSVLATRADAVRSLTATRLPSSSGIGRLATLMLRQIVDDSDAFPASEAARLSATVVNLIDALLGHALNVPDGVPPDVGRQILLTRVQAFIDRHLEDARLTPAMVAAAHHIAPRTLDRLFSAQGLTVAGWIRHRRLERCRQDLVDPAQAHVPIYAIAMRFGFADGPHLTRTFTAAYGMPPRAYRREWQQSETGADVQARGGHRHGLKSGHQDTGI
ncbi:helix-turn-helix domain-containing protein [Rugosimonospora africana]|uniref:AraC-like ligand-binding domain-containing protein n=1 Tax=Rugosimonospora africana TaxID=556532 RepID=UPI001945738A|nr:helix-turn-helix domain-containing protein [Rugosimonospora africana]